LTVAVMDPREQFVGGEAKGNRREETEHRRTPTASKLSNGRTSAPAGNTSILMRSPVAAPTVCAKRTALV
jgi:hypothetical protein